ncbi:MAG: hypothetical protein FWD87_07720 [Spirochaetaceae bacterium]|nr:hypothetical protein [Spirochaetaceae bacterium]
MPSSMGLVEIDWGTSLALPGFSATSLNVTTTAGNISQQGGTTISVDPGTLTFTSAGDITQPTGATIFTSPAGTSSFSAAGEIILVGTNNSFRNAVTIAGIGPNRDLRIRNDYTLPPPGSIALDLPTMLAPTAMGAVVIDWGTGLVLSGLNAASLSVTTRNDGNLTQLGGTTINVTTGDLAFTSDGDIIQQANATINVTSGDLVFDSAGNITQPATSRITAVSASSFTAVGNIALAGLENSFGGVVSVEGEEVTVVATGHITFGDSTAEILSVTTGNNGNIIQQDLTTINVTSGTLTFNSAGNITQPIGSEIIAANTSSFTAAGEITLDGAANEFRDTVTIAGIGLNRNLRITNDYTLPPPGSIALDLPTMLAPTAMGAVVIDWGTGLDLSGLRAASLSVTTRNNGNITQNAGTTISVTSGALILNSAGAITQPANSAISTSLTSTSSFTAVGDINLIGEDNSFGGVVSAVGAAVTVVADGHITVGNSTATSLSVRTRNNGNISQAGGTTINVTPGTLTFDSAGNITQQANATINVTTGTLTFDSVGSITQQANATINVTTGTLAFTSAAGNITQPAGPLPTGAVISVGGISSFSAPAGDIILLGAGNSFEDAVTIDDIGPNRDLRIINAFGPSPPGLIALTLPSTTFGAVVIDWGTGLVLSGLNAASLSVTTRNNGNLTQQGVTAINVTSGALIFNSAGDITQPATSTILTSPTSTSSFSAAGEIILVGTNNNFRNTVAIAGIGSNRDLRIRNIFAPPPPGSIALNLLPEGTVTHGAVEIYWGAGLALTTFRAASLDVTARGNITQSGLLHINGSTTLRTGSGLSSRIELGSFANIFGTATTDTITINSYPTPGGNLEDVHLWNAAPNAAMPVFAADLTITHNLTLRWTNSVITLGPFTVLENLVLEAFGTITQTGNFVVGDRTTLRAGAAVNQGTHRIESNELLLLGAGPYNLTGPNDIGTLAAFTGGTAPPAPGAISFENNGPFTVGLLPAIPLHPLLGTGDGIVTTGGNISLTNTGSGVITIERNIASSGGAITFNNNVEINNQTLLSELLIATTGTTVNGAIIFNESVTGASSLRLTAGMTGATGNIEFRGPVGTATNRFGAIIIDANAVTFDEPVFAGSANITNRGLLSINPGANFDLTGPFTQRGGGAVSLGANIRAGTHFTGPAPGTNTSIFFNGAVSLTTPLDAVPVRLTTNGASAANGITFNNTVNGMRDLILEAGAGNVVFNQPVGGGTPLRDITIGDPVPPASGAGNVTFSAGAGVFARHVNIINSGNLAINSGANFNLTGDFVQRAPGATVSLGANIETASPFEIRFYGAVTLLLPATPPITLTTGSGAGNIVFLNTVNGTQDLTLIAGTGDVTFSGAVGAAPGGAPLRNIEITARDVIFAPNASVVTGPAAGAGRVVIDNSRFLTINSGANFNLTGPFTQIGGGDVNLGANITTSNNSEILFNGAVSLTLPATPPITLTTGAGAGNITFNNTVNGTQDLTLEAGAGDVWFDNTVGATTPLRDIEIAAGAVTFAPNASVVTGPVAGTGRVTINNAELLTISSGANFNLSGNFVQTGAGEVLSAASLVTTGTITFDSVVHFAGDPAPAGGTIIEISANTAPHVLLHRDVYIYLPPSVIIEFGNRFECENFILLSGTARLRNNITLATRQDFVALGTGYSIDDNLPGGSGVAGLFAYHQPPHPHPFARPTLIQTPAGILTKPIPIGTGVVVSPSNYAGRFDSIGTGARILVGQNFYVNGSDMLGPTGVWMLDIPDNNYSADAFAEAYNMTVSNSRVESRGNATATAWVAAAENVAFPGTDPNPAGGTSGWAYRRSTIMPGNVDRRGTDWERRTLGVDLNHPEGFLIEESRLTGTVTIFDNVIRVQITTYPPAADPVLTAHIPNLKFENTNNEIQRAIGTVAVPGALRINNNTANVVAFVDRDLTIPTSDYPYDLAVFYLMARDTTWTTDATGSVLGHANSTDMSGNPRNVLPNIFAPKAAVRPDPAPDIFFSLLDNRKNRITINNTAPASAPVVTFTAVEDFCRPVVVRIETGRDPNTGGTYNWHNFFEITYSEPVRFGGTETTMGSIDMGLAAFPGHNPDPALIPTGAAYTTTDGGLRATREFNPSAGQFGGHLFESDPSGNLAPNSGVVRMSGFFEYGDPVHNPARFRSGSQHIDGRLLTTDGTPSSVVIPGILNNNVPSNVLFRHADKGNVHGIRIYVVGFSPGTLRTIPTNNIHNQGDDTLPVRWWPGYMFDHEEPLPAPPPAPPPPPIPPTAPPEGRVARILPTTYIRDNSGGALVTPRPGNVLNELPYRRYFIGTNPIPEQSRIQTTITPLGPSSPFPPPPTPTTPLRAHWVQPEIAYFEKPDVREVVRIDTNNNGLTDRLEFHIHIPPTPVAVWDITNHPEDGYSGGPVGLSTFDRGKGVRDSSITAETFRAFRIGHNDDEYYNYELYRNNPFFCTRVRNPMFNPMIPQGIRFADDTYFSISFDDIEAPVWYLTFAAPHIFTYREEGGITDLAGNLLRGARLQLTIAPMPPTIQYTIASVDSRRVYVKFDEFVFRTYPLNRDDLLTAEDFEIVNADGTPYINHLTGLPFRISEVYFDPQDVRQRPRPDADIGRDENVAEGIFFILNYPLEPNDLLNARIRPARFYDSDGIARSRVSNLANLEMSLEITYRISNFAIGLAIPVWAMDSFDPDGRHPDQSTANVIMRDFTGKDRLRASDITLEVVLDERLENKSGIPVAMYFDSGIPDAVRVIPPPSNFWIPSLFPGFNRSANSGARMLRPVSLPSERHRNFVIPASDSAVNAGRNIEFIFTVLGLYAGYLTNPEDPRSVTPWKIPIHGIRTQRGGVTILNNVINVSRGDRAVLMYDLQRTGHVTVNIFNLAGNVVKTLVKGVQPQGRYIYTWDGTNTGGRRVARGIYFIRVVGPDIDEFRKVMVVRD